MSTTFQAFIEQLRADLAGKLPGQEAQYRMAPQPRVGGERGELPTANVRRGGVLVLFYPHCQHLYLPLILRPTYDGVHSGQVGFPGGGYEEDDHDLTATALREAYEEVGVRQAQVTVLGQLSPLYVNASNYLVQPTVGWCATRPNFRIDPYEVAMLLETPLAALQDVSNQHSEPWQLRGRTVQVPFFKIQGQIIWGATAMMLSELLALPVFQ
ncbi:MAG: CoA pyrophosphatase [Caldilineaceae bacterium]|nr:CoA pyrophosphatase [Caldilineaceae bacterium]MCB0139019.1 CoA pyrophosphatase [Caldilineaceae bacterium]